MKPVRILACDIGTSQCKVSVFDRNGRLTASAAEPYSPVYGPGNVAEQDPEVWWGAFVTAARQVVVPDEDYACVALTGQMSACLPVDRTGQSLRPAMIWADQRATEEALLFEQVIGSERLYLTTGNPPSATYSGPKILWFKRHEPGLFNKTAYFLQQKDYLTYRLTGRFVTEFSDASCTSLFNLREWVWDDSLLSELDLPREKLPAIVSSTEIVGQVTSEAAAICRIPAGVPVVAGGGDGPTAAVGAGVVESGKAYINLGSSAWISFCQAEPLYDSAQRTFNYCHLVPDHYALTGTMQSAGSSYGWAIDNLFTNEKTILEALGGSLDELVNQKVDDILPGSDGALFLPYLVGERTPYWNPHATGAFLGLRPHHTRYHLVRAVLESIGLHLRLIHDVFAEQGITADRFTVIGGGAGNRLLLQICSDIFQKELMHSILTVGATSLGAAAAGAVGVGLLADFSEVKQWFAETAVIRPDPEQAGRYAPVYARFQDAYRYLEPFFSELAARSIG
jgi:xylulokinase